MEPRHCAFGRETVVPVDGVTEQMGKDARECLDRQRRQPVRRCDREARQAHLRVESCSRLVAPSPARERRAWCGRGGRRSVTLFGDLSQELRCVRVAESSSGIVDVGRCTCQRVTREPQAAIGLAQRIQSAKGRARSRRSCVGNAGGLVLKAITTQVYSGKALGSVGIAISPRSHFSITRLVYIGSPRVTRCSSLQT